MTNSIKHATFINCLTIPVVLFVSGMAHGEPQTPYVLTTAAFVLFLALALHSQSNKAERKLRLIQPIPPQFFRPCLAFLVLAAIGAASNQPGIQISIMAAAIAIAAIDFGSRIVD